MSERLRPRDLYDLIHMFRHVELRSDPATIRQILEEKCRYKNIPFPAFDALSQDARKTELEAEWKNMLAHQLPILPPFNQFWDELPEVFAWLSGVKVPAVLPSIAVEEEAETAPLTFAQPRAPVILPTETKQPAWVPPVTQFFERPLGALEIIRFAGANRLCIILGYNGKKRLVEPYSFRRSKEGNLILHTVRVDNREHRSYRVDKIESAELTQTAFVPRYAIELTESGPLYAPPQERSSTSTRWTRSSPRQKYIFRCSVCGKKFTRQKYDATLNEHKNKDGNKCYGRYGTYEGTKWS